ncbi:MULTISPECIES: hypothetical protein [Halomonadaceae]|uniref:hypothetical protein n=1 Tax=Halomonas TaxID=2745 RepID=UPI0018A79F8F|nr:hypothetical protein [Halomonas sp. 328]MBF8223438.1 hypothetical protein [Halomonas sp. 328]
MRRLAILWLMITLLTACASPPDRPTQLRQALMGLSEEATRLLIEEPAWDLEAREITLLLSHAEVEESLPIGQARFEESLTRALLAYPAGPQVIDWRPQMSNVTAPAGQWLLDARLVADGPELRLSDRALLPYRLELRLRRPEDSQPRWERAISGAFDADAL